VLPFCVFKRKVGLSFMDMEQNFQEETDSIVVYQTLAKNIADIKRLLEEQGSRIDSLYSLSISLLILQIVNIVLKIVFEFMP
jgi:hypothetical protein